MDSSISISFTIGAASVPDPKLRYVYTPGVIKTQDANGDCIDRYTYTDFGTTPAKSALDALREVSGMRLHGSGRGKKEEGRTTTFIYKLPIDRTSGCYS